MNFDLIFTILFREKLDSIPATSSWATREKILIVRGTGE